MECRDESMPCTLRGGLWVGPGIACMSVIWAPRCGAILIESVGRTMHDGLWCVVVAAVFVEQEAGFPPTHFLRGGDCVHIGGGAGGGAPMGPIGDGS